MKVDSDDHTITLLPSEIKTLERARNIAATVAALPHPVAVIAVIAASVRDANADLLAALSTDQQKTDAAETP